MKKLILLVSLAVLAACFPKETVDEVFVQSTDIQLRIDGVTLHTYQPLTWQLGSNRSRRQFRVMKDDGTASYTLTCSEWPAQLDQTLEADLEWTSGGSVKNESGLSMKVVKTDAEGTVWLWCNDKKIGVSIRTLR